MRKISRTEARTLFRKRKTVFIKSKCFEELLKLDVNGSVNGMHTFHFHIQKLLKLHKLKKPTK